MAKPMTIRLRYGVIVVLTEGDEEMRMDIFAPNNRGVAFYLAPDEIGALVEALTGSDSTEGGS